MKVILRISAIILLIFIIHSCKKDKPTPPIIATTPVTDISYTTATSGGNLTDEGGATVVSQGVCWNTKASPTITNNKTIEIGGLGSFTSSLNQLIPNTLYYVRAYAINSVGIGYGDQVTFTTTPSPPVQYDNLVYQWLVNEQLSNGLLESTTGNNFVSLYDNSLAALTFIAKGDYLKAEAIFDFFNNRVNSELLLGTGGFAQFRDRYGFPLSGSGRWLGDNAWLLIALNNYKAKTRSDRYINMTQSLNNWIRQLQDVDGSLWGGYDPISGVKTNKVTENMLDAFNALSGYDSLHKNLLKYFYVVRWDTYNKVLVSSPGDYYMYALDNFSWGYCALENFPNSSLTFANQIFLAEHFAVSTGALVSGYCIDIDRDDVFLEGTGQMVVAFQKAGLMDQANFYLKEIEKSITSGLNGTMGIPYATNRGSGYGPDLLWQGADNLPCVSSAAWYLFGKLNFDPMAVGYAKNIPTEDKFWLK